MPLFQVPKFRKCDLIFTIKTWFRVANAGYRGTVFRGPESEFILDFGIDSTLILHTKVSWSSQTHHTNTFYVTWYLACSGTYSARTVWPTELVKQADGSAWGLWCLTLLLNCQPYLITEADRLLYLQFSE